MSNTPRTDDNVLFANTDVDHTEPVVLIEFARELERELAAARAENADLRRKLDEAEKWREAVDARLTSWNMTASNDSAESVRRLVDWECCASLDPAVSEPAAQLVAEARNAALEEAAHICEVYAISFGEQYYPTGSKQCAAAILALKTNSPTKE